MPEEKKTVKKDELTPEESAAPEKPSKSAEIKEKIDVLAGKIEEDEGPVDEEETAAATQKTETKSGEKDEKAGTKRDEPPPKKAAGDGAGKDGDGIPPDIEGAAPEDLDGLPDFQDNQKAKTAFIKERIRNRKKRQDLEERLGKLEAGGDKTPKDSSRSPASSESPPPKDVGVAEVGRALALRAQAQEMISSGIPVNDWTPEQAKEVSRLSMDVLKDVSDPNLIIQVLDQARGGAFGEQSADVERAAQGELSVVQFRQQSVKAEAEESDKARDRYVTGINAELGKAYKDHPEFKPAEDAEASPSAEVEYAQKWMRTEVGTNENPGPLFEVLGKDPTRIGWMFDRIAKDYVAEHGGDSRALQLENEAIHRKQEKKEQPMVGGRQSGATGEKANKSDKILAQIEKEFPGATSKVA